MKKKKIYAFIMAIMILMPKTIAYAEEKPSNFGYTGPSCFYSYYKSSGTLRTITTFFYDKVPYCGYVSSADVNSPLITLCNENGEQTYYYQSHIQDGVNVEWSSSDYSLIWNATGHKYVSMSACFPIFTDVSSMQYYCETGTTSAEGVLSLPEGYYISSDGSIKEKADYNDNIPTPLIDKVRFQTNTQTGKQILIDFKNIGTYSVQTMFKGEFNYKELKVLNFMSKWQYYNKTSYSYVMNEVMKDDQDENSYPLTNVQYNNYQGYPLYENRLYDVIKNDLSELTLDVGAFQALKTNVKFRFVKVDENNVAEEYGNWLLMKFNWMTESYELQELDGNPTVVIDDDEDIRTNNTEIDRESNYIDIPSSTNSDYQDIETVFTSFKGLMESMGSVPQLFSTCFQFVPQEAFLFIVCGIGFIVALRFLGR